MWTGGFSAWCEREKGQCMVKVVIIKIFNWDLLNYMSVYDNDKDHATKITQAVDSKDWQKHFKRLIGEFKIIPHNINTWNCYIHVLTLQPYNLFDLHLNMLHWLSVWQQTVLEMAITVFDCICSTDPAYFKRICILVADISGHDHLCSAKCYDILVPCKQYEFPCHSFCCVWCAAWNFLPTQLYFGAISCWQFTDGLKT